MENKKTKEFLEFIQYGKIENWSTLYELIGKISIFIHNTIKEYDKITKEDILEVAQMLNYKTHVVLTTKDE